MATPEVASSRIVQVKFGNGATSTEVFDVKCSINTSKDISFEASTNETTLYDCTDPSLIPWTDVEVSSLKSSIAGAGKLNLPDTEFFYDLLTSGASVNVKWTIPIVGAPVFTGPYKLTSFALGAAEGDKVNCTIALASTGPVTLAPFAV